jgi:TRAP-type C4-dicarboxylate transport system permease small subunit
MTPEEKQLLQRSVSLGEANNEMLRRLERHMRFQRLMTWLYWIIIIGSAVGAFYLIEPYINAITGGTKSSLSDILKNFGSLNQ